MPLDFPDSPTVGDTFPPGDPQWVFTVNGVWEKISPGQSVHNSLLGLQGGTAGEYFHLTSAQATAATAAQAAGTASIRALGTGATDAAAGNDSRFTHERTLTFVFDGGGAELADNAKARTTLQWGFVATGWTLFADQTGSVELDVWVEDASGYPPAVANTVVNSNYPALSSDNYTTGTVAGWTDAAWEQGQVVFVNVNSCTTIQHATLQIHGYQT